MPAVNSRTLNAAKIIAAAVSLSCSMVLAAGLFVDQALLDKVEQKYGIAAKQRFVEWQSLIDNGKSWSDPEKLERVNDFFNRNIDFIDDIILWQKTDYWAAPTELLARGGGDCEDYSIAKYFSLVEMGVDENKLRITYVKALELNQAHMVLTYFESTRSVPLVLDNLKPAILPATERPDLQPVYSFNGTGLWLAKSKGSGQHIGGSDRLSMWSELKLRMLESPF
ncbi:transglutaminase-like cysteine peptidase [Methylomonas montana]|uniref:transglutaminase-like cysteine peptidase n=1 Tax=Methylomonas montana TaxID=3058963 RepID=UPI002659A637|nr:transglutaminase-like cysteine peptidase [Methylomonas montana]WKJ91565.1 transglutaminase-like cysteine peptidase [Methylomonas montana]